jgi:hypothetical protein
MQKLNWFYAENALIIYEELANISLLIEFKIQTPSVNLDGVLFVLCAIKKTLRLGNDSNFGNIKAKKLAFPK